MAGITSPGFRECIAAQSSFREGTEAVGGAEIQAEDSAARKEKVLPTASTDRDSHYNLFEAAKASRPFCSECHKPRAVCICARIGEKVQNKTGITILQHPKEKYHPLGSARIALLGLANVRVIVVPLGKGRPRVVSKTPGSKRALAGRVGSKGRKPKPGEDPFSGVRSQPQTAGGAGAACTSGTEEQTGRAGEGTTEEDVAVGVEDATLRKESGSDSSKEVSYRWSEGGTTMRPRDEEGGASADGEERADSYRWHGGACGTDVRLGEDREVAEEGSSTAVDEESHLCGKDRCLEVEEEPGGFMALPGAGWGDDRQDLGESTADNAAQAAARNGRRDWFILPCEAAAEVGADSEMDIPEWISLPEGAALLYPSEKAIDLLPSSQEPLSADSSLAGEDADGVQGSEPTHRQKARADVSEPEARGQCECRNGTMGVGGCRQQSRQGNDNGGAVRDAGRCRESESQSEAAIWAPPDGGRMPPYRPSHFIVLDGTWPKAKRVYHQNPWLQALPHYKLPPTAPSRYGFIRRQPRAEFISTVESIVCALKAVEPETEGLEGLLDVFHSMVEDQVRCMGTNGKQPNKGTSSLLKTPRA